VTRSVGCTLEDFAKATGLPTAFLRGVGVRETTRRGRSVVQLSDTVAYVATPSEDRASDVDAVERRKNTSALFGHDALDQLAEGNSVYIVADEIEALTLRFHELPAVAVPPGRSWEEGWPTLEGAAKVYMVSAGDAEPPEWVADAPFRDRVRLFALPDVGVVNALHRHSERTFRQAWASVSGAAISWAEYEQERRGRLRAEHAALCADLVGDPDILARFATDLERAGFAGETREAQLLYLVASSRLLDKPISAAVKGPSSAGKSFLVKKVLELFPPAAFPSMTAMSPKALIYSKESLAHRVLVLYEADGMDSVAELILRSLLSEGHIVYDTVVAEDGSAPAGKRIEREGPTSFITTTTRISLHRENETRFFSVTVSDAAEHTRAILHALASEEAETIDCGRWHALQEFLAAGERVVTIPFAHPLADLVDVHAVRLRRDFGALLALVRMHALLHQETRERNENGAVVASVRDYAAVYGLVHGIFAEANEQTVPAEVRQTVEAVQHFGEDARADDGGKGITLAQIRGRLEITGVRLDRTAVLRRVNRATNLGLLTDVGGGGRGRQKRIVLGERLDLHDRPVLPTPAELEEVCAYECTPV
jgi:hypothetical protein